MHWLETNTTSAMTFVVNHAATTINTFTVNYAATARPGEAHPTREGSVPTSSWVDDTGGGSGTKPSVRDLHQRGGEILNKVTSVFFFFWRTRSERSACSRQQRTMQCIWLETNTTSAMTFVVNHAATTINTFTVNYAATARPGEAHPTREGSVPTSSWVDDTGGGSGTKPSVRDLHQRGGEILNKVTSVFFFFGGRGVSDRHAVGNSGRCSAFGWRPTQRQQ